MNTKEILNNHSKSRLFVVVLFLCIITMPAESDENFFGMLMLWRWSLIGILFELLASLIRHFHNVLSRFLLFFALFVRIGSDLSIFGIAATCALSLITVSESWLIWLLMFILFSYISFSTCCHSMNLFRKMGTICHRTR